MDTGDLSQKTLKKVIVLSFVLAILPFFFNLRSVANPATVANTFNPSTHQADLCKFQANLGSTVRDYTKLGGALPS